MRFSPQNKLTLHTELNDYLNGKQIYPINIEASITGICNANCSWCFYSKDKRKESINTERLLNLFTELLELGTKAVTFTGGGEPTCHKDFSIISKYPLLKKGLITNGLNKIDFDPINFEWIRVSKTNKDWNKENLQELRKTKTLGLCINYIGDINEIKNTLLLAEKLNLDYVQIRPALNTLGEVTNIEVPKINHPLLNISDYKFNEAKKKHSYTKCEGFHFVPFIWENGEVDVCAYHRDEPKYNLGNIYNSSFKDIVQRMPNSVDVATNCQICCKNHEINLLLSSLKKIEDKDFV